MRRKKEKRVVVSPQNMHTKCCAPFFVRATQTRVVNRVGAEELEVTHP